MSRSELNHFEVNLITFILFFSNSHREDSKSIFSSRPGGTEASEVPKNVSFIIGFYR